MPRRWGSTLPGICVGAVTRPLLYSFAAGHLPELARSGEEADAQSAKLSRTRRILAARRTSADPHRRSQVAPGADMPSPCADRRPSGPRNPWRWTVWWRTVRAAPSQGGTRWRIEPRVAPGYIRPLSWG